MTRDPETERIALLDTEPGEASFPRRAGDWEVRIGEVEEAEWENLVTARLTPAEQTALHRQAWSEGRHP